MTPAPPALDWASLLRLRQPVPGRWLLLAAHPDDEVIAASLVLRLVPDLLLIHATDGRTPGECDDGLQSRRFAELAEALSRLAVEPRLARYDLPDGDVTSSLRRLIQRLMVDLGDVDVLVTHAFEGGHRDHDACAIAAQTACELLVRAGRPVPHRLEFPVYARSDGAVRLLRFDEDEPDETCTLRLTAADRDLKRTALSAFISQRHVVERFPLDIEAVRSAKRVRLQTPRRASQLLWTSAPDEEARWREAALASVEAAGVAA